MSDSTTVPQQLILDTNVFIASLLQPSEYIDRRDTQRYQAAVQQYNQAKQYIEALRLGTHRVHLPTVCLVEIAAVVRRKVLLHPRTRASHVLRTLLQWVQEGRILLYELDHARMIQAAHVAIDHETSAPDSVFIALADECSVSLKTFDKEIVNKYSNASQP